MGSRTRDASPLSLSESKLNRYNRVSHRFPTPGGFLKFQYLKPQTCDCCLPIIPKVQQHVSIVSPALLSLLVPSHSEDSEITLGNVDLTQGRLC